VTVFDDRVELNGREYLLTPDVRAVADSAGNLSRTRRHTLTRFALLGPLSVFTPKAKKHDDRELFLLVEAPDWAEVVECPADAQAKVRGLAQQINVAARNVDATRAERRIRVAETKRALETVSSDKTAIAAATEQMREQHESNAAVATELRALDEALSGVLDLDARYVRGARATQVAVSEEIAAPPTDPGASHVRALPWTKRTPAQLPASTSTDDSQDDVLSVTPSWVAESPSIGAGDFGAVGSTVSEPGLGTQDDEGGPSGSPDVLTQLRELGELRREGLVTDVEFEDAKKQLLARI
jgi:hypothetical protein